MIAMLTATYPGHIVKQVIQAFLSPDIPKRPESVKELSSMTYYDESGHHSVFMYDVPDAQVAEFITVQNNRTVFIAIRAPGLTGSLQWGTPVGDAIKNMMPLLA